MVISSGKSIPSPQLPSHTLKLNLNTFTKCVGTEIERLQTRQVYSITSTHKPHPRTQHSGSPGMTQIQMKYSVAEANLTHHPTLTSPPLKTAFSLWMNVELPNAIVSSLGKSIPSPTLTKHNSQTHSHCRRGKRTCRTQPISDSANLPLNSSSTQHSSTPVRQNRS